MRIGLTIFAAALAVMVGSPPRAMAQQQDQRLQTEPPPRRPPLRLEVRPTGRPYRQCEDWYAVEHRVTGDTIVPRMRCWWAVR
jgi:hypothetical protein